MTMMQRNRSAHTACCGPIIIYRLRVRGGGGGRGFGGGGWVTHGFLGPRREREDQSSLSEFLKRGTTEN